MTHPALDAEYRKVIPAKFVTKRDGSPMLCMTCGATLVMGQAFAAGDGTGWTSYCSTCAASTTAQVAGLVQRVETLVAPLGDDVPDTVTLLVEAVTPLVETVLAGNATNAQFLAAKRTLMTIRTQIGEAKKAQRVAGSQSDPLYQALVALRDGGKPREVQNATSLLAGWDKYGSLTPKQRAWAESMTKAAPTVAEGLYLTPADGAIRKVYTTQNGNLAVKVLAKVNGKGHFNYVPRGLPVLADDLAAGTARLLTQAEAQAFGKLHGFCVNCLRDLDDDRSLAVGYGPVCANHYGWFYPSKAEAAEMLARPQGMLFAPPAGPAVALPAPDKAQRIAEATFRDNIRAEGQAAYDAQRLADEADLDAISEAATAEARAEAERTWRWGYQQRHGRAENE